MALDCGRTAEIYNALIGQAEIIRAFNPDQLLSASSSPKKLYAHKDVQFPVCFDSYISDLNRSLNELSPQTEADNEANIFRYLECFNETVKSFREFIDSSIGQCYVATNTAHKAAPGRYRWKQHEAISDFDDFEKHVSTIDLDSMPNGMRNAVKDLGYISECIADLSEKQKALVNVFGKISSYKSEVESMLTPEGKLEYREMVHGVPKEDIESKVVGLLQEINNSYSLLDYKIISEANQLMNFHSSFKKPEENI